MNSNFGIIFTIFMIFLSSQILAEYQNSKIEKIKPMILKKGSKFLTRARRLNTKLLRNQKLKKNKRKLWGFANGIGVGIGAGVLGIGAGAYSANGRILQLNLLENSLKSQSAQFLVNQQENEDVLKNLFLQIQIMESKTEQTRNSVTEELKRFSSFIKGKIVRL